jgi:GNAT superfamily N-acetyltransferase
MHTTSVAPGPAGTALRPVEEADQPFLMALFAACRPELAALALPAAQRTALLDMQFRAQHAAYTRYPGIAFQLILHDGVPAGRLTVQRSPGRYAVVDIALLPEWRGRGIGAAVLAAFLREAHAVRQTVHLQVAAGNPAHRLYRQLGFQVLEDNGGFMHMALPPPATAAERRHA